MVAHMLGQEILLCDLMGNGDYLSGFEVLRWEECETHGDPRVTVARQIKIADCSRVIT